MNKKNTPMQIILSILAVIAIYAIIIIFSYNYAKIVTVLVDFVILALGVFAGIKLIRKQYTAPGIIILAMLSPLILITLVFGGCFIMLGGSKFY